ncbi:hypothetical protein CHARACLAT_025159, partial [Characodon lateralis]|nr:hypothetical protein [Characodon lateralis]
ATNQVAERRVFPDRLPAWQSHGTPSPGRPQLSPVAVTPLTASFVLSKMAEVELTKRTLQAIVKANRGGVSLSRLQSECKELTGEQIPHKQLDALLANTSSVRMERRGSGEMVYFSSGAMEEAHTAKVVARQRSSKKTGRHYMVNTQMRVKPAVPLVLNGEILPTKLVYT